MAEKRQRENGTIPANTTRNSAPYGRCGYIDFKELRKGMQSGVQHGSTVSLRGLLVIVLIMYWSFGVLTQKKCYRH